MKDALVLGKLVERLDEASFDVLNLMRWLKIQSNVMPGRRLVCVVISAAAALYWTFGFMFYYDVITTY